MVPDLGIQHELPEVVEMRQLLVPSIGLAFPGTVPEHSSLMPRPSHDPKTSPANHVHSGKPKPSAGARIMKELAQVALALDTPFRRWSKNPNADGLTAPSGSHLNFELSSNLPPHYHPTVAQSLVLLDQIECTRRALSDIGPSR